MDLVLANISISSVNRHKPSIAKPKTSTVRNPVRNSATFDICLQKMKMLVMTCAQAARTSGDGERMYLLGDGRSLRLLQRINKLKEQLDHLNEPEQDGVTGAGTMVGLES
jgi:hypothetical protein